MLDQHAVFEHTDLDAAVPLRTTMTRSTLSRRARNSASVMTGRRRPASRPSRATLLLGLEAGRALDALRLGDGLRGLARAGAP
ncbi:MAG: hypothetical protein WDM88_05030 [Galbitalea sp.]